MTTWASNQLLLPVDRYDTNVYTLIANVYDARPFVVDTEGGDSGYMAVSLEDYSSALSNRIRSFRMVLLNSQAFPLNAWKAKLSLPHLVQKILTSPRLLGHKNWNSHQENSMKLLDDVKLTAITAVDDTGEEYKLAEPIYWRVDTFLHL